MLLEGYVGCVYADLKGMRTIPESGLLKSFIKVPVYLVISFGTPGISEISRKKSALVVFRVLYAHYIFSILGVLSFKLSQAKLLLSSVGPSSSS